MQLMGLYLLWKTYLKGDCYNLGYSEANLSKLELCNLIKKYIPQFVFHCSEIGEDPDKRNYIISNAKIESKVLRQLDPLIWECRN